MSTASSVKDGKFRVCKILDRKALMTGIITPVFLSCFTGAFAIVACKFQSAILEFKHAGMQTLFIFFGEFIS